MYLQIEPASIPIDPLIRGLCLVKYKGNSKSGCPNYKSKKGCPIPSGSAMLYDALDFSKDMYLIYTTFPIGEFADKTKKRYPQVRMYPDTPESGLKMVEQIKSLLRSRNDWPDEYYPEPNSEPWESSRTWHQLRWWQGTARAEHKKEIARFKAEYPSLKVDKGPEARGVNITGLMLASAGIQLRWQWPPVHNIDNIVYQVSIAGVPNYSSEKFKFIEDYLV